MSPAKNPHMLYRGGRGKTKIRPHLQIIADRPIYQILMESSNWINITSQYIT